MPTDISYSPRSHGCARRVRNLVLATLVVTGHQASAAAGPEFDILNPNAVFSFPSQTNYLIVQAGSVGLKDMRATLLEIKSDDGQNLSLSAVKPIAHLPELGANQTGQLEIKADSPFRPGTYTASVTVYADRTDNNTVVSKSWTFRYQKQPVEFRAGDSGDLRFVLVRPIPFATTSQKVSVAFRPVSVVRPSAVPTVGSSQLYRTVDNIAYMIGGSSLSAAVSAGTASDAPAGGPKKEDASTGAAQPSPGEILAALNNGTAKLDIEVRIPGGQKNTSGKLTLFGPELKTPTEIGVAFAVKDAWIWLLLTIVLGVVGSFLVTTWVTRSRLLAVQRARAFELLDDLANYLEQVPAKVGDKRVAVIRELVALARRELTHGDAVAASKFLDSAAATFAELKKAELRAAAGNPWIELLTPVPDRTTTRIVHFRIFYPGVAPIGNLQWSYMKDKGDWTMFGPVSDKPEMVHQFDQPGTYVVRAVPDSAGTTAQSAPFSIEQSAAASLWRRIWRSDRFIEALAVFLATIFSFATYDTMLSFGTVGDYALAFGSGFGFTELLKGFGPVLNRLLKPWT